MRVCGPDANEALTRAQTSADTRSAASSSDCANRCAYVESTVFALSPRRAATIWTGMPLVSARVAAVCRSTCSVRRYLNTLLEVEHVVRTGEGKKNNAYRWSLDR